MKGSCQQTRTDTTAADRPPDAEKRRDTQRHPKSFRNPQPQLRLPTPGRAGQGGRPNPRPDSTESTTDTHGRPVGNWQLTCFRSAASASAGCPSCPAHPSSNYLRRLRRRPRRQPAVSAAARAFRPLQRRRRQKPPPQQPRSRRRSAARKSWCWQLDLAVCQSENGTLGIINAIEHRTNCFFANDAVTRWCSNTERTAVRKFSPFASRTRKSNELPKVVRWQLVRRATSRTQPPDLPDLGLVERL